MVLWELTLATAYVLGLKRTYRIALRGQKRILGDKYPRIRDFTERRTRAVFTMALSVYKEIQRRDLSVGRSVGNWLLRWLDQARPQANIRGSPNPPKYQSGKGRRAPPRLENKRMSNKNGTESRYISHESVGLKSPGISHYTSQVRGRIGSKIRSRITDGIKPTLRSLPSLALGLWWQPMRRQSRDLSSVSLASNSLALLSAQRVPSVHILKSRSGQCQQSVFRADIARWINAPTRS